MRYDIINQDCDYERENKIYESIEEVEGYTYMFTIAATNKHGETREFDINFQAADRSNSIQAYGDFELERSTFYGDSGDESDDLLYFFAGDVYDDNFDEKEQDKAYVIIEELQAIAEDEAEKLINELNSHFDEEQADIEAEREAREAEEEEEHRIAEQQYFEDEQ